MPRAPIAAASYPFGGGVYTLYTGTYLHKSIYHKSIYISAFLKKNKKKEVYTVDTGTYLHKSIYHSLSLQQTFSMSSCMYVQKRFQGKKTCNASSKKPPKARAISSKAPLLS
jgi:hypothetical protein